MQTDRQTNPSHPEQSEGSFLARFLLAFLTRKSSPRRQDALEFGRCPQNDRSFAAFTLAEVLITLGIIGVVAAMTIPILINKTNELQYKTAYRNAYADLSNAFNKAKYDGEFLPINNGAAAVRADFDAIKANFKVVQSCENSLTEGCWIDSCDILKDCSPETLSGEGQGKSYGFVDNAGRSWAHYKIAAIPSQYPLFIFDTNGAKGPNSFGRDRWFFALQDAAGIANNTSGVPFRIWVNDDILTKQENGCAQGNCYYKSWLIGN